MYIPAHTALADSASIEAFLHHHSFATLVTCDAQGVPFATHIPVLFDAAQNILRAHIARANPQWQHFQPEREVLVIFSGAHSYISSLWYQNPQEVSTWNYTAVHVYGTPHIISDAAALHTLLADTNRMLDGEQGVEHFEQLDSRFREGLMRGIVGFSIIISRTEAKFKLSQNKNQSEQQRIVEHLETQRQDQNSHTIAALMREREGNRY